MKPNLITLYELKDTYNILFILLTWGIKPVLDVVIFLCPSGGWSGLTGDELGAVVKIPGGEKVPLISTPGTGTRTPPTRIEYSVFGSNPFTRNWVSEPV